MQAFCLVTKMGARMAHDVQKSLNDSFLKTLKSSELASLPLEVADAVSGLPVFSTLAKIGKSFGGFADYLFAKRILRFLQAIDSMPEKERADAIDQKFESEKDRNRFAERVLESIRRLDDERSIWPHAQPKLPARLLRIRDVRMWEFHLHQAGRKYDQRISRMP